MNQEQLFNSLANKIQEINPTWYDMMRLDSKESLFWIIVKEAIKDVHYNNPMKQASSRITINPTSPNTRWGTSLQGYVEISFAELCSELGEPAPYESGDGKILAEWLLIDEDTGVVASVYCYKEKEIPLSTYKWHVGGFNEKALALVQRVLPNHFVSSTY